MAYNRVRLSDLRWFHFQWGFRWFVVIPNYYTVQSIVAEDICVIYRFERDVAEVSSLLNFI